MTERSSLNWKKMINEGFLEHQYSKKNNVKIEKYELIPISSLELSKLSLTVEASIIILNDVILNVWRGNI